MCRWSTTDLRIGRIQQKEVVKDFVGGSISHHQYSYLKYLWKEGERRRGERLGRERKMEGRSGEVTQVHVHQQLSQSLPQTCELNKK